MAFRPLTNEEGKRVFLPAKASVVFTKGDAILNTSGYADIQVSGSNIDSYYVADETVTASGTDGATLVACIPVAGVRFEVDTSNTPTAAQAGVDVDFSAAGTIDSSATTDQVFHVEKFILPLSAKKAIGFFVRGAPNA